MNALLNLNTNKRGPLSQGPQACRYESHFSQKFINSAPDQTLGCSAGDTTANLMWRLERGEDPAGIRPKAVVLLIGSNDLLLPAPEVHPMPLETIQEVYGVSTAADVSVVGHRTQFIPGHGQV